jgi:hypothetical protein
MPPLLIVARFLQILLSSGAHLSRYLLQSIIGHYTRSSSLFYNRQMWCRALPFSIFAYIVKLGAEKFGDNVDVSKGQDDGTVFSSWLDGRKYAPKFTGLKAREQEQTWQTEQWNTVSTVFEKYGFIPFRYEHKTSLPVHLPPLTCGSDTSSSPRVCPSFVYISSITDSKYPLTRILSWSVFPWPSRWNPDCSL